MQVQDLILMFCLLTGQGPECRQQMGKCVGARQQEQIQEYAKAQKDNAFDKALTGMPPPNWPDWLLECGVKVKKK